MTDWWSEIVGVMNVADADAPTPDALASLRLSEAQSDDVGHHVLQCVRLAKPDWAHVARAAGPTPPTPTDAEIDAMDPDAAEIVRAMLATAEPGPQAWIEGERDGETQRLYFGAQTLHRLWQRATARALDSTHHLPPAHPLAPWFEAGAQRPRPTVAGAIRPTDRPDPLFPGPLVMARQADDRRIGALNYSEPGRIDGDAWLPGLAPGEDDSVALATLPTDVWRMGGGAESGSGGPMGLPVRTFVSAMIDAPNRPGDFPMRMTAREMLRRILPPGARITPSRYFGRLLDALDEGDELRLAVTWDGVGTKWSPFHLVGRPDELDDWVAVRIEPPPGSHRGFIVDRPTLRIAGAKSAVAYRLHLALAAHWNAPGTMRRPLPGKRAWYQSRNPDHYPVVSARLLVAMAFPAGVHRDHPKRTMDRATSALRYLADIGYVNPDSLRDRRLMPGPTWSGWGGPRPANCLHGMGGELHGMGGELHSMGGRPPENRCPVPRRGTPTPTPT